LVISNPLFFLSPELEDAIVELTGNISLLSGC